MLFLDDLQFADPASLRLVAYLARRLAERPILIVARVAAGGGRAGADPLRRQATARRPAWGGLGATTWPSWPATAGMGEQADRLFDETEGLPLFVVEYLAAAAAPTPRTATCPAASVSCSPPGWTASARPRPSCWPPPR